jgi:hypothetical protein
MLKRPYYTGPSPRRVKTRPFPGFVLASLRGSTQRIRGTLVLQLRIQVELRSAVESFNRPFFPLAPACSGSWRRPHWRQPSPSDQPITGNGISSTIVPDATALNAFASWPALVVRMSSGGGFSLRGSHDLTDHGFVSGFVLAAMLFRQSVILSLNPSFIFFSVSVSVYGFFEIWSVDRPTPNTDGEDSWDHSRTIPITKDMKHDAGIQDSQDWP